MNAEELARKAGFNVTKHLSGRLSIASISITRFERLIALVRAEALEEAAQLCESERLGAVVHKAYQMAVGAVECREAILKRKDATT
jgi:hypothetical protein